MPTTEQIIQINSVNNDISVDPDPTNNFYKSSNNTIRCPEGKVFQGSYVLSSDGEELSVLRYNTITDEPSKWFKSNGTLYDRDDYTQALQCVPKYCGPQGIVNSDKYLMYW